MGYMCLFQVWFPRVICPGVGLLGHDCVDHNKLWKILKEMEYQTTWPASWETYKQVRKQQLELDLEQQTGSKEEKEYIKAVYCHPAYLTSMQGTSA